jgi:IMP dehydrogenase
VRRQRDQGRPGPGIDLHHPHRRRRRHPAAHRPLRRLPGRRPHGRAHHRRRRHHKSGDIVKALTLADAVICGGLLAGCREAPGEIMEIRGKLYKQYRGMGSLAAMKAGSAARYGHDKNDTTRKVTAEGIEALKEVSGSVDNVLADLIGGIQSGMGYLGAPTSPSNAPKSPLVARVSRRPEARPPPHDVIEVSTHSSQRRPPR